MNAIKNCKQLILFIGNKISNSSHSSSTIKLIAIKRTGFSPAQHHPLKKKWRSNRTKGTASLSPSKQALQHSLKPEPRLSSLRASHVTPEEADLVESDRIVHIGCFSKCDRPENRGSLETAGLARLPDNGILVNQTNPRLFM